MRVDAVRWLCLCRTEAVQSVAMNAWGMALLSRRGPAALCEALLEQVVLCCVSVRSKQSVGNERPCQAAMLTLSSFECPVCISSDSECGIFFVMLGEKLLHAEIGRENQREAEMRIVECLTRCALGLCRIRG